MTVYKIWRGLYTTISGIVIVTYSEIEQDPSIDRPVLVSVNLSGSEPDWILTYAD